MSDTNINVTELTKEKAELTNQLAQLRSAYDLRCKELDASKEMLGEIVQTSLNFRTNFKIAFQEAEKAQNQINALKKQLNDVVAELATAKATITDLTVKLENVQSKDVAPDQAA